MSDDYEYISNPRLRVLAEELRILNDILIEKNLPDRIRLFQLRDFAHASKQITGITFPQLQMVQAETDDYQWNVMFKTEQLGPFTTPTQAINAYKHAHIEHYGIESEYHPDHPIDDSHLHGDDLPPGIRVTPDGKYVAIMFAGGCTRLLGTFDKLDDAVGVYQRAKSQVDPHWKANRDRLPTGVVKTASGKFKARTANQHLGTFDTIEQASDAFQQGKANNAAKARAARSAQCDARRKNSLELYGNTPLPTGVRMSSGGKFTARIKIGTGDERADTHLGVFNTPHEAHEAFKKAHVNYHGKASPYYDDQKEAA